MIIAAGLSPAWQQILVFDKLQRSEVNRAAEAIWCASGKVLDVAVALHHLGAKSHTIAVLGGPPLEAIDQEFRDYGADTSWVISRSKTRVCTTLVERDSGVVTELVENAPPMFPQDLADFQRIFGELAEDAQWAVITGSIPEGVPKTVFRDCLKQAPETRFVLDIRGEELLSALEAKPFLVKPNRQELASTLGRPLPDDAALLGAMRELNDAGAQWVVVTQGEGSVWATSEETTLEVSTLAAERVVNPIACGDCFAAALAWTFDQGGDVPQALRNGVAAARLNLEDLLPSRLDPQRLTELASGVQVEARC